MTESQVPASTIVLVDSVLVDPPRTIDEEEPFPVLPPASPTVPGAPSDIETDDQPKRKGRPRLMRGLSRMSSFPSLKSRTRASSTPYDHSGATMSCSSLAPFSSVANSAGPSMAPLTSPIASRSDEPSSSLPMSAPLSSACTQVASNGQGSSGDETFVRKIKSAPLSNGARPKRRFVALWSTLPREIKIQIFAPLRLKDLVRISRVNREFHALCFDGQLWSSFDTAEFYREIPAKSLSMIALNAGPFVKNLNLRGCIQTENHEYTLKLVSSCRNLVSACLEGSHINTRSLRTLLEQNIKLVNLNLSGLSSVDEDICTTIAENCPQLEVLNMSWCKNVLARYLDPVIRSCTKLRDLRLGELHGIDTDHTFASALFEAKGLERLILSGSPMVSNVFMTAFMRGPDADADHLATPPNVLPRRLRHLDLGHCRRLTQAGLLPLAHCVPELEGFVLSGCTLLTDAGLIPMLETCPKLTHLEFEDLTELTNALLVEHLAKAPCAGSLKHLSLSYCEKIGDAGVLPVLRACKSLRSLVLDNTQVSDLVLAEAAALVSARQERTFLRTLRPRPVLNLTVYDCPNITWTGVREVLSRNAQLIHPRRHNATGYEAPYVYWYVTFPTEIITLKCFYGWQMTVDEHTKRVRRCDFAAAARLEEKWGNYMQASEEAGMGGRRRRRRAREARQEHANEAGVDVMGPIVPRRRARTASCAVM